MYRSQSRMQKSHRLGVTQFVEALVDPRQHVLAEHHREIDWKGFIHSVCRTGIR